MKDNRQKKLIQQKRNRKKTVRRQLLLISSLLTIALTLTIFLFQSQSVLGGRRTPNISLTTFQDGETAIQARPEPAERVVPDSFWDSFIFYENITVIDNPEDYLALVNKNHQLPTGFSPDDLRVVNARNRYGHQNQDLRMRESAATALEQMIQAASQEAGLALWMRSGYRSYQTQRQTHQHFVNLHGQAWAEQFSARPGHSEHQLGLAIDLTAASVNGTLQQDFSQTAEGQWLRENAHHFGFILRYPADRIAHTGYEYEPWHFRYVGIETATTIYENDWILEDFLFFYAD